MRIVGLICVVVLTISVSGKPFNHKDIKTEYDEKYAKVYDTWSRYKRRFRANILPEYYIQNDRFNELEAVQLIPSIIEYYRLKDIKPHDAKMLMEIYGNLWFLMQQEIRKPRNSKMTDPLLQSLINSFYLLKGSRSNENGREGGVRNGDAKPYKKLHLSVDLNDPPSQKVLKIAAMLINQEMNEGSRQRSTRLRNKNTREVIADDQMTSDNFKATLDILEMPSRRKRSSGSNPKKRSNDRRSVIEAMLEAYKRKGFEFYVDENDDYEENVEREQDSGDENVYGSVWDLFDVAEKHQQRTIVEENKFQRNQFAYRAAPVLH